MIQLYGWLASCLRSILSIRFLLIVFLIFLGVKNSAFAVEIDAIVVTEKNGIYHIYISGNIAVTEKYVRQVLTDYKHVYRLNSSVIESKVFESPVEGNVLVRSRLLYCATLFCREVERMDEISTLESGDLLAVIVPEKSDFHSGRAIWKISPIGNKTRLIYSASIEPNFFIPPVLGTKMVIQNMRNEFRFTFSRIEQIARVKEKMERTGDYIF